LQELQTSTAPLNQPIVDGTTPMEMQDADSILVALDTSAELDPSTFDCTDEPRTWEEALQSVDSEKWRAGYLDELNSLKDIGVYTLVPRSEVPPVLSVLQRICCRKL
jgi:hypothetical protein